MTLLLSRSDVGDVIEMRKTINSVEEGFRRMQEATIPERIQIKKDRPLGDIFFMPGLVDPDDGDQTLGMKTVTIYPDNDEQGLPRSLGSVQLFDPSTGVIDVIMDGSHVTNYRTGAIGAVAARFLAPPDPTTVGIIGSSTQGRYQAIALDTELNLETIRIYSRSDMKYEAVKFIAERVSADVVAGESPTETCADADIVVTATTATSPVVPDDAVSPGTLIIGVGSNDPDMREISGTTMARAEEVFVDDYDLCLQVGDIQDAIADGNLTESQVTTMTDLVTDDVNRTPDDGVAIVKSVGSFALDIPVSQGVLKAARKRGRGTTFDLQDVGERER